MPGSLQLELRFCLLRLNERRTDRSRKASSAVRSDGVSVRGASKVWFKFAKVAELVLIIERSVGLSLVRAASEVR